MIKRDAGTASHKPLIPNKKRQDENGGNQVPGKRNMIQRPEYNVRGRSGADLPNYQDGKTSLLLV